MKIAIIGAGNVGTSLGSGWAKAGHQIIYGVRNPQDEKARQLKAEAAGAEVTTYADAARAAEVVVISTRWGATEAAVRACGNLRGKTVIDVTNPLKPDISGLDCGFNTSGGEQVAQWANGAEVFKTMNQVGFNLMDHPEFRSGLKPVMLVAGNGVGKAKVCNWSPIWDLRRLRPACSNTPACWSLWQCSGFILPIPKKAKDATSPFRCCESESVTQLEMCNAYKTYL